jgi:phosphoglycerol transferase MdoB-like AlkP superfamily enzyme
VSKSSSTVTSSGFGCFGLASLLLVAFIVLKLTHYIDWSWWWVTAPLWIYGILAGILIAVVLAIAIIATIFSKS